MRHLAQIFGLTADAEALLRQPTHKDSRPNPLFGRRRVSQRIENGVVAAISLHRQCGLVYRLPGQGYCSACPLAPEHRRNA
jgi:ferric iron reductase protein FhuF